LPVNLANAGFVFESVSLAPSWADTFPYETTALQAKQTSMEMDAMRELAQKRFEKMNIHNTTRASLKRDVELTYPRISKTNLKTCPS